MPRLEFSDAYVGQLVRVDNPSSPWDFTPLAPAWFEISGFSTEDYEAMDIYGDSYKGTNEWVRCKTTYKGRVISRRFECSELQAA